jgi:cobalt-zinc-cadmium efflux system outer membrane protein
VRSRSLARLVDKNGKHAVFCRDGGPWVNRIHEPILIMRRLLIFLLSFSLGCHACPSSVTCDVEGELAAVAGVRSMPDPMPCSSPATVLSGPLDLPTLWSLALANNPSLREAAADVAVARGQLLQASKYPNPRLVYSEEDIGTKQAAAGNVLIQASQEIVTGGKRRLDMAIARQETEVATLALLGRKFDVLTRIRRAYAEYVGWWYTVQANQRIVASLEKSVAVLQEQVEVVKNRPRVDLVRSQSVLEEARTALNRNRASLDAAWEQLAAEVGVSSQPPAAAPAERLDAVSRWEPGRVLERVMAANAELKRAAAETERVHLEVERARAEAMPNVTLGGGFARNFAEDEIGGVVSVEVPLPLWDRKQGRLREAEGRWARAQAAQRTAANRLRRDTAEAFGRYQAALRNVDGLRTQIIPRLEESAKLVLASYQARGAQITFTDVLLAEVALNEARLRLEEVQRELRRAIADLQGLMQLDADEEWPDS